MDSSHTEGIVMDMYELLGGGMFAPDATRPPMPAQEYYSIKQAALITSLSPDHIRRSVTGGTLVASNMGTNDQPLYRIHRDNLKKWMDEREGGAKPPKRKAKELPKSDHFSQPSKKKKTRSGA